MKKILFFALISFFCEKTYQAITDPEYKVLSVVTLGNGEAMANRLFTEKYNIKHFAK